MALPLLLVAVAGTLRFARLGVPDRLYFDEVYYANDADQYLQRGVEDERAVHPPLGKWLIAAGVAVFGFNPVGWRASAALAGTLTVLVTYLAGRRLFAEPWVAAFAGLLLAVDGLAFTMSRIAMLDVFLALFASLAFYFLLAHHDSRAAGESGRGWLLLTGVALGMALATKWTGVTVLAAALAFVLAGEWAWGRRSDDGALRRLASAAPPVAVCLVAVPALIYLVSYSGWFANVERTEPGRRLCSEGTCPTGVFATVGAWWSEQADIVQFHRDLVPRHPDRSPGLGWPVLQRPVLYYFESCEHADIEQGRPCRVAVGHRAKIVGLGNPAVWWSALLAYPVLAWMALRRREWRAAALLLFLLGQWLPWVLVPKPGFFYYMTATVPFMCLGLAYLAERCGSVRILRRLPAALAVAAVAAFAFFYPVYAAVEMPKHDVDLRTWTDAWR